ncbi:SgcJ/EcaC family oxidoreductase [Streptomyces sp. NPDC049040]|uniref:SgcJ/EcaC family oxidoreductase n=1 Tax=Streptomyces sp. NPDC049040 TaxID=3365593 RepID=UPI003714F6A0
MSDLKTAATDTPGNPMAEVLARWKAAFDGHRTDAMAALFTPDALFQGFDPEVAAGREAVRAYYAAVAQDRTADVTLLHTYAIGAETAGGFADVTFRGRDGWEAAVHLSLVLRLVEGRWLIRQYHVSRVATDH